MTEEQPLTHRMITATSAFEAELAALIWALECIGSNHHRAKGQQLLILSDCQSIVRLPQRRQRLESQGYRAQRSNKILKHALSYQKIFQLMDQNLGTILWIKGHVPQKKRDGLAHHFSQVDQFVRKKLREGET